MVARLADITVTGTPFSETRLHAVRDRFPPTRLYKHSATEHRYVYGLNGGGTARIRLIPNSEQVGEIEYLGDGAINGLFYPFAANLVELLAAANRDACQLTIVNSRNQSVSVKMARVLDVEDYIREHCR